MSWSRGHRTAAQAVSGTSARLFCIYWQQQPGPVI
jgi:hypothetical protein